MEKTFYTLFIFIFIPLSANSAAHHWPNETWRAVAETEIVKRISDFEQAKDKEEFCPGYSSAPYEAKINCWSVLVRATVRLESTDNPGDAYMEPMGYNSVGLLQLSANECKNAKTERELKNAKENLICGINKMANLVRKGNRIEGKSGAGAYWSVLRQPYTYGSMKLGKVRQIQAVTKNYKDFTPSPVLGKTGNMLANRDNPALSGTGAPVEAAPRPTTAARAKPEEKVEDIPRPPAITKATAPPEEEDFTPPPTKKLPQKKARKKAETSLARSENRRQRKPSSSSGESDWAKRFWEEQQRGGN